MLFTSNSINCLVFFVRYFARCLYLLAYGALSQAGPERDVAFGHGAMGRRIDPSWGGPIELFLVPASAPRLV